MISMTGKSGSDLVGAAPLDVIGVRIGEEVDEEVGWGDAIPSGMMLVVDGEEEEERWLRITPLIL